MTGYLHPAYMESLSEFGVPTELPNSKGWFLKRNIPGYPEWDGLGSYPYLACCNWPGLADDLKSVSRDLVSFSAVPDPFGKYELTELQRCFGDHVVHFKDHYVADLLQPPEKIISKHHRQHAEKALRQVEVEICLEPLRYLDQWCSLFEISARKFQISGIRAYSRSSFNHQFRVPGITMTLARNRGELVAAHIWHIHENVAYAHLAAASPLSYDLGAAYALYHEEVHYFPGKVRWLDWGGEPGASPNKPGLSFFKKGWSTGMRPVYFCGRIFNRRRYDEITQARGVSSTTYFPAYRKGEFD